MTFQDLIMIKTPFQKLNIEFQKVFHHMQGLPNTMQIKPQYNNVLLDIYDFLEKISKNLMIKKLLLILNWFW